MPESHWSREDVKKLLNESQKRDMFSLDRTAREIAETRIFPNRTKDAIRHKIKRMKETWEHPMKNINPNPLIDLADAASQIEPMHIDVDEEEEDIDADLCIQMLIKASQQVEQSSGVTKTSLCNQIGRILHQIETLTRLAIAEDLRIEALETCKQG